MGNAIVNENNHASMRKCAFCQHWYDPANSAIRLQRPKIWEYDLQAKNICRQKNVKTLAFSACAKFISKI